MVIARRFELLDHRFNIVSVGIESKRGEVVVMIFRSRARRTIVAPSMRKSGVIEGSNGTDIIGFKSDVGLCWRPILLCYPKERLAITTVPIGLQAVSVQSRDAQRLKGVIIK